MNEFYSIEDAIKNGDSFFFDKEYLSKGKSGGTICPTCRKWSQLPRKRKNHHPSYINFCEFCEIKDPILSLWKKLNLHCSDKEREVFNNWLRELRLKCLSSNRFVCSDAYALHIIKKIIYDIPFLKVD